MMRVLMPVWSPPPLVCGGMDIYAWELASRLKCKVIIPVPSSNIQLSCHLPPNVEVIPIDIPNYSGNILEDIRQFNDEVFKHCKDFDIIHSNDWIFAPLALRYKKELDKKFVLTVHSLEYMRAVNPLEKNNKIEKIEKEIFPQADAVITVSSFMEKRLSYLRKEVAVIYNGAPSNNSKPHRFSKNILFVGRLSKQKGIEYLILAAKEILSVDGSVRFTIVGDGYMRKKLEYLAKVLGIDDNIHFTGFIPHDKIAGYYQSAGIFVVPSIYEPFGIVIVEAMSFGVPVIAAKNTGASEPFTDGEDIILVNERSSTHLTEKIMLLLKDKDLREKLSSNASRKLHDFFSWDKCADKTLEVYENL